MKVGVGYCNDSNAYLSGKRVAADAIRLGAIQQPDLVLAFCSGEMDSQEFMRGMREIVGDTPVIGGGAIGIITNNALSYSDFPAGAAVFQLDGTRCQIATAGDLDRDGYLAGSQLAGQLSESPDDKLLLLFYDSLKVPASPAAPPVINASAPLLEGIQTNLESEPLIIGAGLLGDYQFSRATQFCGSDVRRQSAVAVRLSGPISAYYTVTHGCSPLDGRYRTISKMQGSNIYELDGQPVVELIDQIYNDQSWRKQHPLDLLTIGVNYGERFEYEEDKYVNRLITGILPDGKGIGMFESDLQEGVDVQFMLRDGNKMISSAQQNTACLMQRIIDDQRTPLFALYIDCAGRAAGQSHTETEEAGEIQTVVNKYATPLLGFYSGVEVAPVHGKCRGLDWTGVLMVLARDN